MNTSKVIAEAATLLEAEHPAMAAKLRAIKLGRKRSKKPGHTAHNLRLADAYERIKSRIASGQKEDEAVEAEWRNLPGITLDVLWDAWKRHRPAVVAILRERGM